MREQAETDALRLQAAELWAPGAASAGWRDWEAAVAKLPATTALPGLVRVGTTESGVPYLTPLLGEAHVSIGDTALLERTRPRVMPPRLPVSQVKQWQRDANRWYAATEQGRLEALEAERTIAVGAARGLIARSVASLAPGTVDVTIYDPRGRGEGFRDLAAMGQAGQSQIVGDIERLLRGLERHIVAMNGELLDGYPTMRSQVSHTGRPGRRWQLVVLFGHNERLSPEGQGRLQTIIEQGVACGISLVTHGLEVEPAPRINQLSVQRDLTARASGSGPEWFTLDPPPPSAVLQSAAQAAVPTGPTRLRMPRVREVSEGLAVATTPGRRLLPGAHYRRIMAARAARAADVARTAQQFEAAHPFLSPDYLRAFEDSALPYLEFARAAAHDPAEARRLAASPPHGNDEQMLVSRLQAAAMLDLLTDTPGHTRERFTQINHGRLGDFLPKLADIVRTTPLHGIGLLPKDMQAYIGAHLPTDVPAYVFQLVAGLGNHAGGRLPRPGATEARDATLFHLEKTYDVPLRGGEDTATDLANRALADCLIECELLRLYDFANAPPELQALLAQRAQRRLLAVPDAVVPTFAQQFRGQCLQFLEARGGPVLSRTARTVQAVGGLASKLGSSRRRTPNDGGGQTAPIDGTHGAAPNGANSAATPGAKLFTPPIYRPAPKPADRPSGQAQ